MKKLIFLILLSTGLTGFASPPVIQNPTPLEVCDYNNDSFETFDLTPKISEVLGALDPSLYTVSFYETLINADSNINPITNPNAFGNIANPLTVYVRVAENATGEYSIASFQLNAIPTPTPGQPINLSINQDPFVGSAIFDLTVNNATLVNGSTSATVTYFPTIFDAQAQTNPFATPTAFLGTNGQIIWARIDNVSGCAAFESFHLYITNPNIVFIPDANFKAKLIQLGVDTNTDGEIQESEAGSVGTLDISNSNISDITGIQYFLGMESLYASNNTIANVDLTGLNMLSVLYLNNNLLTSLNVSGITTLNTLNCSNNQLVSLNLTGVNNFTNLDCSDNQLTSLDVSNKNLMIFKCTRNQLSSLLVNNTTSFQFYCDENNLSSLDLSTASISQLYCNTNQITNLILGSTSVSFELHCENNLLTALNLTNSLISNVWCANNLFTTLDFSGFTNLTFLDCGNNPQLTALYVKNGRNEIVSFNDDTNLQFICADEGQLISMQTPAAALGAILTTYCTFTPGGNYNTVTGAVRYDSNNDGCDNTDIPMGLLGLGISLDTASTGSSVFTDNLGNYTLYMSQAGTYTLNPNLENSNYFTVSPTNIDATTINNTATVQDICIIPNGIHPDIEVVVAPIDRARPGFEASYQLVIKNKGNQPLSGTVNFTYDDTLLDFISSDLAIGMQRLDSHTYTYTNLPPFQNRSTYIKLRVHAPTETPAVNIGDQLNFTATVSPTVGDDFPEDNACMFKQIVIGSFDPNDITCIEGNMLPPSEIGNYLHYIINFENTGTAEAENIVVKEIINSDQFDISTLQVLNSSAILRTKVTGNVAEFIFQNINLHSGGHGNILIKIKSKNTLTEGDTVSKKANIYFDYNFPVETLPADTVFQTLSNPEVPVDASITLYPNPTKGIVNVDCSNTIQSIQLYDIQGRLLQTNLINQNQAVIDISTQSNGIYFLKVVSDKGISVQKVSKE